MNASDAGLIKRPVATERSRLDALKARKPRPGEASFFYRDHHFKQDAVKVLPGEYYVTGDDIVIMTVLGSCIAACIYDPRARVGGMNHFMLPEGGGRFRRPLRLLRHGTADQRDDEARCPA